MANSKLDKLFEFVIASDEELLAMSREEIREYLRQEGLDPDGGKERLRQMLEDFKAGKRMEQIESWCQQCGKTTDDGANECPTCKAILDEYMAGGKEENNG